MCRICEIVWMYTLLYYDFHQMSGCLVYFNTAVSEIRIRDEQIQLRTVQRGAWSMTGLLMCGCSGGEPRCPKDNVILKLLAILTIADDRWPRPIDPWGLHAPSLTANLKTLVVKCLMNKLSCCVVLVQKDRCGITLLQSMECCSDKCGEVFSVWFLWVLNEVREPRRSTIVAIFNLPRVVSGL